jgi:hypothetical protein
MLAVTPLLTGAGATSFPNELSSRTSRPRRLVSRVRAGIDAAPAFSAGLLGRPPPLLF